MSQLLLSRDALLGIGVCLIMLGIILRGFARNFRRDSARRKEHLRDERISGDAGLGSQLEQPPGWLERHFGLLANLVLVVGVVAAIVALWPG